jgi:hypothetical protein
MNLTIYDLIKISGIEFDNHCSDLQFPVTEQTTAIVEQFYPNRPTVMVETFRNCITGERWYEIPFAYSPFWEAREAKV